MKSKSLTLATRNAHKVRELAAMLPPEWSVRSIADIPGLPEIEETGSTFLANATLKAAGISRHVEGLVMADDSGLEVDALGGAPGVYSARYAGLPSNDANNNAKLLRELEALGAMTPDKRRARFRCVLVLAEGDKVVASFDGTCEGCINILQSGANGFGYDPLFIPDNFSLSFGELPDETKAKISHRSRALAKFLEWAREI